MKKTDAKKLTGIWPPKLGALVVLVAMESVHVYPDKDLDKLIAFLNLFLCVKNKRATMTTHTLNDAMAYITGDIRNGMSAVLKGCSRDSVQTGICRPKSERRRIK
jgi:hypothetical protein